MIRLLALQLAVRKALLSILLGGDTWRPYR